MKKTFVITLALFLFVTGALLAGCSRKDKLPAGEYTIEDVVYVGVLSSSTLDALKEAKAQTKVIIKEDSLEIISPEYTEEWIDLTVVKDELSDELISSNYPEYDKQLATFFSSYSERFRYSLFDKDGQRISYNLFQLDDELFISQFARNDALIFSIDKFA
jgi:hypothetical protein